VLAPSPQRPVERAWDSTGWTLVGERTVDGRIDSDKIDVSQKIGKITKLMIVVLDGDLEMVKFHVIFVDGKTYDPAVSTFFREGTRTRGIDLPRTDPLRRIDFTYKNLTRGGRARVQVWGRDRDGGAAPAPAPAWDSNGWTMLGERSVDGKIDHDFIDVSQKRGKMHKLTIVVLDSDLEMIKFEITFVDGKKYDPAVNTYFREATRTRAIELPRTEILRRIDFTYKNLPGGGKARVQVWGRA
jgi:hypothetical protein